MAWDVIRRSSFAIPAVSELMGEQPLPALLASAQKVAAFRARVTGRLSRPMRTEADLQRVVLDLMRLYGWKTMHQRPAQLSDGRWVTATQGDGKGFPDIVAVRGSRLLFAELKSGKGRVEPAQQTWLDALRAVSGVEIYVWRPNDLPDIQRALARRTTS